MFKEMIDSLEGSHEGSLEDLVADSFILEKGTYIQAKKHGDGYIFDRDAIFTVNNNTDREVAITNQLYKDYVKLDLKNKYITSNKSVADKNISSCTGYSLFVKKENLLKIIESGDFSKVDTYFKKLVDFDVAFKGKKDALKAYKVFKERNNYECPVDELLGINNWLQENLNSIEDIINEATDGTYIKIFFETEDEKLTAEYNKYLAVYLFLDSRFCEYDGDEVYGIPNLFNSANLERKPLKFNVERAYPQQCLVDSKMNGDIDLLGKYLTSKSTTGPYLFIQEDEDEDGVFTVSQDVIDGNGFFINVNKGKSLELQEWDILTVTPNIEELNIKRFISDKYDDLNYDVAYILGGNNIESSFKLESLINRVFFCGKLSYNYFKDARSVRQACLKMPRETSANILKYRQRLMNWLVKNIPCNKGDLIDEMSYYILKQNIEDRQVTAVKQLNIRMSLLEKWKGESYMYSKDLSDGLYGKINNGNGRIENDYEFAYALGQLTYFVLKVPNLSNNRYASGIFEETNVDKILQMIKKVSGKYKIADTGGRYYREIFKYILEYRANGIKDFDDMAFIHGYLSTSENIMYKSSPKAKEAKELQEANIENGGI